MRRTGPRLDDGARRSLVSSESKLRESRLLHEHLPQNLAILSSRLKRGSLDRKSDICRNPSRTTLCSACMDDLRARRSDPRSRGINKELVVTVSCEFFMREESRRSEASVIQRKVYSFFAVLPKEFDQSQERASVPVRTDEPIPLTPCSDVREYAGGQMNVCSDDS